MACLVTYVWTMEGWLYLAVVLDLYSQQVVGWAMSDRLKSGFVIEALRQAVGRRDPDPGCIFHSDRGVQYACDDFRADLRRIVLSRASAGRAIVMTMLLPRAFSIRSRLSMCMITGMKHGQRHGRVFLYGSRWFIIGGGSIQLWGTFRRYPLS